MIRHMLLCGAAACALALSACGNEGGDGAPKGKATVEEATKFLADAEAELTELFEYGARIAWVNATNITDDTDWLAARSGSELTLAQVRLANATKRFEGLELTPEQQRKMQILKSGITMPSPSSGTPEEAKAAADELAGIMTGLQSTYGKGKFTIDGEELNLEQLSNIIASSRDPAKLKQAWEGWHTISPPMKADYARMVEIGNAGAKELGFQNVADMWLSNYDMPSADMEQEVERLWTQVEPLYKELHCSVRADLSEFYGADVQAPTGPIRADLLGNMWAQQWNGIYDIVAPPASDPGFDLNKALVAKKYDPLQMVKTGEAFFTSLGLAPLPETFWTRSQITRPRDREVVCHASAWNVDNVDDLRIKMCTQVNAEDFSTVHHELGHNFYQRAYNKQDFLFRNGANDGFHEAIGDFVALSITPEYLKQLGLISVDPPASADMGLLMDRALEKIAFLPFAIKVDKWRWQVLRGETTPDQYNQAWVELGERYQGITPPGPRPADAFDPGAKFHIPGNTPYLRYFLSFVLQFQFHKAACEQAGWTGPLHRCSIYNNKEVGQKFNAMLEMGMSKPWPDALEAFTGTRQIDASAMVEYFEPLSVWMREKNAGRTCGW